MTVDRARITGGPRMGGTRKFSSIPSISDDPKSHTLALRAIIDALDVSSRRTTDLMSSSVRVQDLVDMGIATFKDGRFNTTSIDSPATTLIQNNTTIFNVQDYDAVGDGTTDDTAAFQATIDALVEAGGGELYVPYGAYKITSGLTVDGQSAADPATFSFLMWGEGRRASRLVWAGAGTMLTIANGAGNPQNGVGIYETGFYADSAHTVSTDFEALLRIDYGLDARIMNCLFNEGKGTQLYLGRAQNVLLLGNEFRGDGTNTEQCIYVTNAPSGNGQGLKIISCTIRGARGGTTGAGVWFTNNGGGEHLMIGCMVEGNKIGVLLEGQRHTILQSSFENSVNTDTQIQVGVSGGTRAQHHTIKYCTLSASNNSGFKCIDAVNYNDLRIVENRFISTNGTNVYFGADENNSPSYLIGNELSMDNVAFNGTDGKVVVRDNSSNGTNNPRKTLADGETTPSVANFDIIATANTAPTTITNFLNGYPGKIIMVAAEDANTSIGSGARIDTLTGSTTAMSNGQVAQFQAYVGSGTTDLIVWKQIQNLDFNISGGGGLSDADYGDITVTGGGTTMTIDNDAVTYAKLQNVAGFSVVGKATTGSGDAADITAADETVLGRTGAGNVAFAQVATGQIANSAVTLAKIANIGSNRLLGRDTAGSGVVEELQAGIGLEFTDSGSIRREAISGDVVVPNTNNTATIQSGVVTLAKMADLAQDQFIGRTTASTGVPQTATITSAARTVLDDTTVGAMLTTMGGAPLASPTFTGTVTVPGTTVFQAGSSSASSWPKLTSGTVQTTPDVGSIELDSNCLYATTDAGNRGVVSVEQWIRAASAQTLTSSGSAQNLFDSPANGRLTIETGAYYFRGMAVITGMSGTSGNAAILFGGTGTFGGWLWRLTGLDNTTTTTIGSDAGAYYTTNTSAASAFTAGTGTAMRVEFEGSFECSVAGTWIPQITLVTAAAATVVEGSFLHVKRIGSTSMASVGQWD